MNGGQGGAKKETCSLRRLVGIISNIASRAAIPVIACGGAGSKEDFSDAILKAGADAVSASSVFHYYYACAKEGKNTMQFSENRLRMGEHIDSGNIDFLNNGYGGEQTIMVNPCSLRDVKKHMQAEGINVRI